MTYSILFILLGLNCSKESPTEATPTDADQPAQPQAAEADHAGHDHAGDEADPSPFSPAPANATVAFRAPADGASVAPDFHLAFLVEGMVVKPAGVLEAGTGHHHIIIDGSSIPEGEMVPADEKHIHFGNGASQTPLTLEPGEHTVTLQFADGLHRSYGPNLSKTITLKVQDPQ